jgi:hypothetical protein
MKTSNKILIAFASALILIPLIGMVYISRVEYKVGKDDEQKVYENDHFKSSSPDMASTAISQPFSAIQIKDAKGYTISIRLVEDKDYGVKVDDYLKDEISASVDANGELQLVVKSTKNVGRTFARIIVYAPKINRFSIAKANQVSLYAKLDSLNFMVNNTPSIYLDSDVKVNKLSIAANGEGDEIYMTHTAINSLNLALNAVNLNSNGCSFANLTVVTTAGKNKIEIRGDRESKGEYTINNLKLNTAAETDIKIKDVNIDSCSGTVSDQAELTMPVKNLRQLFKK